MANIYPMGLIFTSILLLAVPGIIFNNFTSSGLNPGFSLSCPGYPNVTCQNSDSSGCQLDPSSCSLQGTSISFLNQASPFTDLIRGDWLGFITSLAGTANNPNPESPFQIAGLGTNNLFAGSCQAVYYGQSSYGVYYQISQTGYPLSGQGCTALNAQGQIIPSSGAPKIGAAPYSYNQTSIPFYGLKISNYSEWLNIEFPAENLQSDMCNNLYETASRGGALQDELLGCQYYSTSDGHTTYWYFALNVNFTQNWVNQDFGAEYSVSYCLQHYVTPTDDCPSAFAFPVTVQPETWDVYDCATQYAFTGGSALDQNLSTTSGVTYYNPLPVGPVTPQCSALSASIAAYSRSNGSLSSTLAFGAIWLLIGGVLLFIVGSGINYQMTGDVFGTGGGVGVGVNRQGTKLAQVLGLALVVWAPMWSEFSSWFTSGILPNGLDGVTGIISILIGGIFFGGVFWQATQD